jgi:hypothetical protein
LKIRLRITLGPIPADYWEPGNYDATLRGLANLSIGSPSDLSRAPGPSAALPSCPPAEDIASGPSAALPSRPPFEGIAPGPSAALPSRPPFEGVAPGPSAAMPSRPHFETAPGPSAALPSRPYFDTLPSYPDFPDSDDPVVPYAAFPRCPPFEGSLWPATADQIVPFIEIPSFPRHVATAASAISASAVASTQTASEASTQTASAASTQTVSAASNVDTALPQAPPLTRQDLMARIRSCHEKRSSAAETRRSEAAYVVSVEGIPVSQPPNLPPGATFSWSIFCNICCKPMLDEHYHCNICRDGDFDLCVDCVTSGKHCLGEKHWLIKRILNDGRVTASTTEVVARETKTESSQAMPGAFTEEKKAEQVETPTRTCNCCVKGLWPCPNLQSRSLLTRTTVFEENAFVTCTVCEDYDLCVPCLEEGKHGHHPGHGFESATALTVLSETARTLCRPGRDVQHEAMCDECDKVCTSAIHQLHFFLLIESSKLLVFVTSV